MMNARIQELRKQASTYFWSLGDDALAEEYDKKFAELLIQECANVCLAQRDPGNLNYKPSEKFAEAVKQHFGI